MVMFIQYDLPPLKADTYMATVTQTVNLQAEPFTTSARFVVTGERFSIDPNEISSVYPPNGATGEFTGVLPHVVFTGRTLPWERTSVESDPSAPWLAVFSFNEAEAPVPVKRTAADLVPLNEPITVAGSSVTGVGQLPAGFLSYPGYNTLDYGELPTDACLCIDVPVALFSNIAPSAADLFYLGHIREVDTTNTENTPDDVLQNAVVIGNRIPQVNGSSSCYLVSLENFGPYLPAEDGTPSSAIPSGTQFVRLVALQVWKFFTNDLGQNFEALLEGLNTTQPELSSLQAAFARAPPSAPQVH